MLDFFSKTQYNSSILFHFFPGYLRTVWEILDRIIFRVITGINELQEEEQDGPGPEPASFHHRDEDPDNPPPPPCAPHIIRQDIRMMEELRCF